ncbi:site-specific integrase, partial [Mycolicibacterium goodii]|nr:site-specific integrase [Mycolicibacterium goodii]
MLETSHHSITQYQLPTTGEIIPLLHIAPSKTDQERLLVVSPELADVLATIVTRVRGDGHAIPLVSFYDENERSWEAPAPLLFQWTTAGHRQALSTGTIRIAIREAFEASDLKDADGQPLYFRPHDFRRIFTTDA